MRTETRAEKTAPTFILFLVISITVLSGCGPGFNSLKVTTSSSSVGLVDQNSEASAERSNSDQNSGELRFDLKLDAGRLEADWNKKDDAVSWNRITIKALEDHGSALLTETPSDAKSYCPRFARLDTDERAKFWVKLISAMAMKESSFNEDLNYTEKFNDSTNTRVISRGLLQISKESALNYHCEIDAGRDLLKAENNLPCGVKILNHWMARDKMIGSGSSNAWKGGARYWSVFRRDRTKSEILSSLAELEFCKARE